MSALQLSAALLVNPLPALLLAALFILVMLRLSFRQREKASVRRHRRYQAAAARVLEKLGTLPGDGQRMRYLRKINPYVFEELLLLALERQGLTVVRNASYSGDGGTDGQVIIDDECWLIQAKRYSRAITPTHIRDFDQLLEQRTCCGFFIHTGRTGHMSRAVCSTSPRLFIISGQRLLDLLAGRHSWLSGCSYFQRKSV
ncbi:restriction endonuclease [Salmonella enterica subsp. enterica serovar 4,[5],12:i:-]|uniref:Restriction endonuclease n=8 Tax=Salmonella TaxID=590 RepID=A0A625WFN9_SALEN|nr:MULTISPECIES: restriction endonuclease [Enterobacteriaceae]EAB9433186.1 restriction endonuclease [Salmonella enterica subsp. enterica serovar Typhimurium str. UK-1]EBC9891874.1 restriction endonuclease [Salmonella enterica subsp. enterica serovar Agona]EBH0105962.1 restriction endonuclease [Salmonella enterica subsp. enterica serovar 4:i:-]EBH8044618.1 restriction endonuclease [Salmonella bongori]EBH9618682.1 restriction endonuclease [Salmonella enterica subsp. enterica serovar Cerro]EBH99